MTSYHLNIVLKHTKYAGLTESDSKTIYIYIGEKEESFLIVIVRDYKYIENGRMKAL